MARFRVKLRIEQEALVEVDASEGMDEAGMRELALRALDESGGAEWELVDQETTWRRIPGDGEEWWTGAEAADYCGIAPSTWRTYVAMGYAPAEIVAGGRGHERQWEAAAVREFQAKRSGRAGRPPGPSYPYTPRSY